MMDALTACMRRTDEDQVFLSGMPRKKGVGACHGQIVYGSYVMDMSDAGFLGEGSSGRCRRGTHIETGREVAVKVFKTSGRGPRGQKQAEKSRFQRAVSALLALQEPLHELDVADPSMWHEELSQREPSELFVELVDYSRDASGQPGVDPATGKQYIITELAQYKLTDYVKGQKKAGLLTKEAVKGLVKRITLVAAALHAKGLVHLDLKPENLMVFGDRVKMIDVDGCTSVGTVASMSDNTMFFSPLYASPEWARFVTEDKEGAVIKVTPALDIWSIGMTISEMITSYPLLKPEYMGFCVSRGSQREGLRELLVWLGNLRSAPDLREVAKFDRELARFLMDSFLVCEPTQRRSCAQTLSHPYFTGAELPECRSDLGSFEAGYDLRPSDTTSASLSPSEEEDVPAKPRCNFALGADGHIFLTPGACQPIQEEPEEEEEKEREEVEEEEPLVTTTQKVRHLAAQWIHVGSCSTKDVLLGNTADSTLAFTQVSDSPSQTQWTGKIQAAQDMSGSLGSEHIGKRR